MIQQINPANITHWDKNPRRNITAASLTPLCDSMRAVGWFGSILVRPDPSGAPGVYQVIAGERRLRAAQSVGLAEISCEVREMTDQEAIEFCVIENRDRQDLDIIEEARAYQTMLDLGWEVDAIVSRSGRSKRSIQEFLGMSQLPKDLQTALRENIISKNVAIRMKNLRDEEDRAEILDRLDNDGNPLSEKAALPIVAAYLEEQKRIDAWEKIKKTLAKQRPELEVLDYGDSRYHDMVPASEKPQLWRLAPHARGEENLPTWGELAAKHGAEIFIGAEDEEDPKPVEFVLYEPLIEAERVLHEGDPENCIFPIGGRNVERHAQGVANERNVAAEQEEIQRRKMQHLLLRRRWFNGMIGPLLTDRWNAAKANSKSEEMADVIGSEIYHVLQEVLPEFGIDLEALGGGDEADGALQWWKETVETHGVRALAWLIGEMEIRYLNPSHLAFLDADDV